MEKDKKLTINEVLDYLEANGYKITSQRFNQIVKEKSIPRYKIGVYRYKVSDIDEMILNPEPV